MLAIAPRDISSEEALVVAQAIVVAANSPDFVVLSETVASLKVHSVCECGCASINFRTEASPNASKSIILADGLGTTRAGNLVGVIVWGSALGVTGLEIYTMSSTDDGSLPVSSSIRPFEVGAIGKSTPN
jgi:hypothetical protein